MLVIQEGGYNVDYLGQHASGVARALISGPNMGDQEPTPADKDAGVSCMQDIDSAKCKEWALIDIEKTLKMHSNGWRFTR